MMNGRDLNDQIKSDKDKGVVADVIAKKGSPAGVYDELFLMTLSRHPTQAEVAKLEEIRTGNGADQPGRDPSTGKGPTGPGVPVPGAGPAPADSQLLRRRVLGAAEHQRVHAQPLNQLVSGIPDNAPGRTGASLRFRGDGMS